jgi:predicted secreted Zn-dependent protease
MAAYESASSGLEWRVSRTCESGACVAVARSGESILIGNSNKFSAPASVFTTDEWREFLAGAKLGHFDGIA